jgi:tRNA threonylcarbamoyladenosine biosynthesis protein TsaE
MEILLASLEDTRRLARTLATCILKQDSFAAILQQGDLGSGKTTLTRMLVPLLPGGDQAEVSSPSFTVMNIYPTRPETVHFDFYRTQGMGLDGTMEEYLYNNQYLCIAEWIDYLPEPLWPDNHLLIQWTVRETSRKVVLSAQGALGNQLLACLGDC